MNLFGVTIVGPPPTASQCVNSHLSLVPARRYGLGVDPLPHDPGRPFRVLVADGQRLFAEALGAALAAEPDLSVVAEHPVRGDEALDAVARTRPDVLVYDFWMLGSDGAAATRMVGSWGLPTKVLLLSAFHGGHHVQRALAAGAVGFLPKSLRLVEVVAAVRRAAAGEPLVHGEELARLVDDIEGRYRAAEHAWHRLGRLTPRELQILQALCEGRPLKELASQLSITLGTLKNHVHSILSKTGARTQLEAVNMARREGLVRETGPPPSPADPR